MPDRGSLLWPTAAAMLAESPDASQCLWIFDRVTTRAADELPMGLQQSLHDYS